MSNQESVDGHSDYRKLFHTMLDGLAILEIILDGEENPVDFRILDVNPAFERMTGLQAEEVLDRTFGEVLPDTESPCLETFRKVALTGEPERIEEYPTAPGSECEVVVLRCRPGLLALTFHDVTGRPTTGRERAAFLHKSHHARRMEALETLAGGIAHDFNNILGSILGYGELVELDAPEDGDMQENLEHMLKAAYRAKDLVLQLLTFSRKGVHDKEPVRLEPLIEESIETLRTSLPSNITIRSEGGESVGPVIADAARMRELLGNLCAHAADSMRETGGTLEIGLSEIEMQEGISDGRTDLPPGRYAQISLRDTGCGMSADAVDRIFEPYSPIDDREKGARLGLAVIHGIVTGHGGDITVESIPGAGTTFRVLLPLARTGPGISQGPADDPLPA